MFTEYLDEQGQPYVSPFIGEIKRRMSSDQTLGSPHPSSFGLAEFNHRATEAALGKNSSAIVENRVRSKHRSLFYYIFVLFYIVFVITEALTFTCHPCDYNEDRDRGCEQS